VSNGLLDAVLRFRRASIVAAVAAAVALGWSASALYLAIVADDFRDTLELRIQREAANLQGMTLTGKAMGAVALAGQLNATVRAAASQDGSDPGSQCRR
jgi:hypothetical protein